MLDFRRELLKSVLPANLQIVIKKIIKPKGIRRKNLEGFELLNYMEGRLYSMRMNQKKMLKRTSLQLAGTRAKKKVTMQEPLLHRKWA